MYKQMIMVKSNTFAFKGKEILEKNKFSAYVDRTPKKYDSSGCGFSIFVDENADRAVEILKDAGIDILGII